jgi:hypothetical protein
MWYANVIIPLNHGHQQSEKKKEKLKTEKDREFGTEKKDSIQKSL